MLKSFKYKFILSFVTVEIFFILCIVSVNFFTINTSSKKLINSQLSSTSVLLQELVKAPISVYDLATLDNVVMQSKLDYVNSIIVLDSQKRVLSKNYNLSVPFKNILESQESFIKIDKQRFELIRKKVSVDDLTLGHLIIVFDLNEFKRDIAQNEKNTFYLILLEILVSTIIAYLIGSKLTGMLINISAVAGKIGLKNTHIEIPYKSEKNEIGELACALDIMQKDIENSAQELVETKNIFNNMNEGMLVVDGDGFIEITNSAFFKILSYKKDIKKHNKIEQFLQHSNRRDYEKIVRSLLKDNSFNGEFILENSDHSQIFLLLNITKYYSSNSVKYVIIFSDVTKNKEKDKLLEIQSRMAVMGEMLGNIAHQWRQPLSSISYLASGMRVQDEIGVLDKESMYKSCDDIVAATKFLSNTIEDFRSFFRTEKNIEVFDLEETLNKAVYIVGPVLKNNNIDYEMSIEEKIQMRGYPNELLQAFLNIVNNAKDILLEKDSLIKLIRVSIEKKEDKVEIAIHDNGGGVSGKNIKKIFEPYFTTKHQSQGTGIGLYMTHTIITKHFKGNIEVKNMAINFLKDEYFGAKFIITLPLDIEQA